jgi:hypothetical protein
MPCSLKNGFIVVMICWGAEPLFGVPKTPNETEPNRVSVSQLLDKFSASYDKASKIRSYIVRWEELIFGDCSFFGSSFRKTYESCERITDGERFFYCEKKWGHCLQGENLFISKNDAEMRTWLWDGKNNFFYGRMPTKFVKIHAARNYKTADEQAKYVAGHTGSVSVSSKRQDKGGFSPPLSSLITSQFYCDTQPIDKLLRQADKISISDKIEKVADSNCYFVEAVVPKHVSYKLWIDFERGYSIARAEVFKGADDIKVAAWGVGKGTIIRHSLENVHFAKFSEIWIPFEMDLKYDEKYASGGFMKTTNHRWLAKLILNPDFDEKTFVPKVPDGWKVDVEGLTGNFTWQDGKVVDKDGKVVLDFRSETSSK